MIFVLVLEQFFIDILNILIDLILILEFEAIDVVSDLALRVNYSKIILFEEVESHQFIFAEFITESTDHIFILELSIWCIVINERKEGKLARKQRNHIIICGRTDVFDFFLEAIFFQDHHLIFEHIFIVLFKQLFVRKVYAKLFQGIIPEVLKPENIQEVDRIQLLSGDGVESFLNLVNNKLEHCIVDRLTYGVTVTNATSFAIGLKADIFMHYLLLL